MADLVEELIDRLAAVADPSFAPPPFDAAVAEGTLGPSGAPRTPHRRLLERMNGAYLHGRALHLLGACEAPAWHSLRAWNEPTRWRDAYGALVGAITCFAEDAFGDQFAYTGNGGEIVILEAELGRVVPVAPHFTAWLEQMVQAPETALPIDVVMKHEAEHRRLQPGEHLFAYPPLCTVEAQSGSVTIGLVDAVEAMRFRGSLAQQLHQLPTGTRIKIDIPE